MTAPRARIRAPGRRRRRAIPSPSCCFPRATAPRSRVARRRPPDREPALDSHAAALRKARECKAGSRSGGRRLATLDLGAVARVRDVVERVEPALVSEHLSFSFAGGTYLADLLPLPMTEEALGIVCRNV